MIMITGLRYVTVLLLVMASIGLQAMEGPGKRKREEGDITEGLAKKRCVETITLIASDGKELSIKTDVACLSTTIRAEIGINQQNGQWNERIEYNNIAFTELETIKNVLEVMYNNAPSIYEHSEQAYELLRSDIQNPTQEAIGRWIGLLRELAFPAKELLKTNENRLNLRWLAAQYFDISLFQCVVKIEACKEIQGKRNLLKTLPVDIWKNHIQPELKGDLQLQVIYDPIMQQAVGQMTPNALSYGGSKGASFSINNRLIAVSEDRLGDGSNHTLVLHTDTLQEHAKLNGHTRPVKKVVFSANGQWLATTSFDNTVIIWNANTFERITQLQINSTHHYLNSSVVFSPDSKWFATDYLDHTVIIWDTSTWRVHTTLDGHGISGSSVAFSPNGKWFVTSESDTVTVWDTSNWVKHNSFKVNDTNVGTITFFPNNASIAVLGWNSIMIYDIHNGQEIKKLSSSPHNRFISLALHPSGKWFFVGDQHGNVSIFDTITWTLIAILNHCETKPVALISFSHDGTKLITGDCASKKEGGCIIKVWDLDYFLNTSSYLDKLTYEQIMLFKNLAEVQQMKDNEKAQREAADLDELIGIGQRYQLQEAQVLLDAFPNIETETLAGMYKLLKEKIAEVQQNGSRYQLNEQAQKVFDSLGGNDQQLKNILHNVLGALVKKHQPEGMSQGIAVKMQDDEEFARRLQQEEDDAAMALRLQNEWNG